VRRAFEGGEWKAEVAVRTHFQPLLLALLTTLLSFVGLAASGFPGLQEIAVFSLTGLTTSWLCALVLLPLAFRSGSPRMPSTLAALSRTGGVARLTRLRTVIGVAALFSAYAVLTKRARWISVANAFFLSKEE
jgi:predicted exporter